MSRFIVALLSLFIGAIFTPAYAQVSPQPTDEVVPQEEIETIEARTVFGDYIFRGQFANQSFVGFNPNYDIAVGDKINLQLWGGFEFAAELVVDAQGNVFVPQVGPIAVAGVKNQDLNARVTAAIKRTFKNNVGVYASLNGAEPVKVYVTGFVRRPGLFAGHASDSVLRFLDQAGGIDPARGSFLNVQVLRGGALYRSINLYEFILSGALPQFQLSDGDTIVVTPVKAQAGVFGDVQNPYLFEFTDGEVALSKLLDLARVFPQATHVRISRNSRVKTEVEYLELASAGDVNILPGDVVEVVSDKSQGTISVRVEGEHTSAREYVLPYGSTLGELLNRINFGQNAQTDAIQLLRESVKERQREALLAQLRALENSVLTARSNTQAEAALRAEEARSILQWVERAREVEPRGLVSLSNVAARNEILLEPGDIIRVPRTSNLVLVHGDVLFPSAMAFEKDFRVADYIAKAGGYTQPRSAVNVLVLRRDGTFDKLTSSDVKGRKVDFAPGDEIFVLSKVQTKHIQIARDIVDVIFQVAFTAGVFLGIR